MWKELGTMILQRSDKRRVPWPTKLLRRVYKMYRNIMALRSRYSILAYTRALQTLYAAIMAWRLLLTSNKVTVRNGKNGLKIITCKLQPTPWPMITYTNPKLNRELSWYARLTYITKRL